MLRRYPKTRHLYLDKKFGIARRSDKRRKKHDEPQDKPKEKYAPSPPQRQRPRNMRR
jgi:hypothetical protein